MSNSLTFALKLDEISPSLSRLSSTKTKERVLMGAGTALESLAVRAFDEPGLRPTPWPARKSGGGHPLLIRSGDLRQSIHTQQQGANSVKVGSPKNYAALQQFGGTIQAKPGKRLVFTAGGKKVFAKKVTVPARPFFPVLNNQLTGNAQDEIRDVVDALVGKAATGGA